MHGQAKSGRSQEVLCIHGGQAAKEREKSIAFSSGQGVLFISVQPLPGDEAGPTIAELRPCREALRLSEANQMLCTRPSKYA